MASLDTNRGAKRAREARAELGLGAADPLACILTTVEHDAGIPVNVAALPEGIAGGCWRDGTRTLLWVNGAEFVARQRFTLAHEFGHLRCGHDGALPAETVQTLSGKATDWREIQANAFAAEFLAPAEGVRACVAHRASLEDAVRVAARFGVSTIVAVYRLKTLGLTADGARLEREVQDELHLEVWERLEPAVVEDALSRLEEHDLPRLRPGSALTSLLTGAASVETVAALAGCDPARLAAGAAAIGPG